MVEFLLSFFSRTYTQKQTRLDVTLDSSSRSSHRGSPWDEERLLARLVDDAARGAPDADVVRRLVGVPLLLGARRR